MKIKIRKLNIIKDNRGWLSEILRARDLKKKEFGQIFVTTARSGIIKAGHYHRRNKEWICVIRGQGLLTLVDNKTKEKKEIKMGKGNMVIVEIPLETMHYIKNIGKNMMYVLAYVEEEYNPKDPDTYSFEKK